MEILYVKLTWFSAEWSRLVILVLYFTLICGVTSDVPRWISANIQMKAPPQCLSLSLLIVELQVGVPVWQLNYSLCVYPGVYFLWFFGGFFFFFFCRVFQSSPLVRNVVNTSYSRFWKWDCLSNHHIHSISSPAVSKAGQEKRTKRGLPPNLKQQHKTNIKLLDYKFYCNYSIYKVLCNRDLNSLESLLPLSETFWLSLCWLVAFGSTICKDV